MPEDGGVLENLPRSRPGKRSEKRPTANPEPDRKAPEEAPERPAAAAAEAAERAETAGAEPAEPAAAAAEGAAPKPSDRVRADTPRKPSDRARAGRASGAAPGGRRQAKPRARAKPSDRAGAAPRGARGARSAPSGRRHPADPVPEEAASGHPDPVGGVIRGGLKVAGTGVRVVRAVTGEVLRRLPRP